MSVRSLLENNRRALRGIVFGFLAIAVAVISGCASSSAPAGQADFVLVYLKTGPSNGGASTEERKATFDGHMANMRRMADEGKLIVAGPFAKPRDAEWRGIFVMDTPKVETAKEWSESDPGVRAGVFVLEFRPMRASAGLRKTIEFEKELRAEMAKKPAAQTSGMPPNVRGYVMATAGDAGKVWEGIAAAGLGAKVVWCGRFTDAAGGGVFVLDAKDVKDVSGALASAGVGLDGWWSTKSLERLPAEVRTLP
jgi:uncharacterized protein YciI